GRIVLQVVDAGQRGDRAGEARMARHVLDPPSALPHPAPIPQRLDVLPPASHGQLYLRVRRACAMEAEWLVILSGSEGSVPRGRGCFASLSMTTVPPPR